MTTSKLPNTKLAEARKKFWWFKKKLMSIELQPFRHLLINIGLNFYRDRTFQWLTKRKYLPLRVNRQKSKFVNCVRAIFNKITQTCTIFLLAPPFLGIDWERYGFILRQNRGKPHRNCEKIFFVVVAAIRMETHVKDDFSMKQELSECELKTL